MPSMPYPTASAGVALTVLPAELPGDHVLHLHETATGTTEPRCGGVRGAGAGGGGLAAPGPGARAAGFREGRFQGHPDHSRTIDLPGPINAGA